MNEQVAELEQIQSKRLRLLEALYEGTGGDPLAVVPNDGLYQRAGLDETEGDLAFRYLLAERLVAAHGIGGLAITHEGLKEIEEVIAKRGRASTGTTHFPVQVINAEQNIHGATASSARIGGQGNTTRVTSTADVSGRDLASMLAELRRHAEALPDNEKHAAIEHVEKLHEHASSDPPDTLRMKLLLEGLKRFPTLMPVLSSLLQSLANVGA